MRKCKIRLKTTGKEKAQVPPSPTVPDKCAEVKALLYRDIDNIDIDMSVF